jgi:hypothetical protein
VTGGGVTVLKPTVTYNFAARTIRRTKEDDMQDAAIPQVTAQPDGPVESQDGPPPRRRRWVVIGLVLVLAAVGGVLAVVRPFGGGGGGDTGAIDNGAATSLATVTERTLSSRTNVDATLGYAGDYSVVNQAQGIVTDLPAVGDIVKPGQVLYEVNGSPVVLLRGSVPSYRSLSQGMSGPDVRELNADLVALGYATAAELDPTSDDFTWRTRDALKKLQDDLGVDKTGVLALGQAVFLPTPVRITAQSIAVGTPAPPGSAILSATSTLRRVTIDLDAAQQSQVKVGDRVIITLPDNTTTPGVVTSVGTVATTPSDSSDTGDTTPTIAVEVTPTHPAATGHLDQAPVLVSITTATVKHALVVPVNALLALANGGYAVEISSGGTRHLVPVDIGIFDDADGLVQVSGSGLSAGQRVVVPAE